MRKQPNKFERELVNCNGLQIIVRNNPHRWFDVYYFGMHLTGMRNEREALIYFYSRLGYAG